MCLKLSFSHSKWVLQGILSMTVLSNCISDSSILTLLFSLTVLDFLMFLMSLDRKFSEVQSQLQLNIQNFSQKKKIDRVGNFWKILFFSKKNGTFFEKSVHRKKVASRPDACTVKFSTLSIEPFPRY